MFKVLRLTIEYLSLNGTSVSIPFPKQRVEGTERSFEKEYCEMFVAFRTLHDPHSSYYLHEITSVNIPKAGTKLKGPESNL